MFPMDISSRAPLPSPHDDCVLPLISSPSLFASICGHFFGFGFFGQIFYTMLELAVAFQTHGKSESWHSVEIQLALLGFPLACAVMGVISSCKWPLRTLAHPAAITGYIIGIVLLGMFDLFVMLVTSFIGTSFPC